jgi:hypothetical protein
LQRDGAMPSLRTGSPALAASLICALAACGGVITTDGDDSANSAGLSVPSKVRVDGQLVDVESNYLPRVVSCENPGAPYEALKAQAIASRTYLTYRAGSKAVPSITDGQSDQVYTCAANANGQRVAADAVNAVRDTSGQVVLWNGSITAGFFVSGANRAEVTCRRLADSTDTEKFVTFNFGNTDQSDQPSTIGNQRDPANRGCFAQRLANCLVNTGSFDANALVRYFYGSDVQAATIGTPAPPAAQIRDQAASDYMEATCWSDTLGRPVPYAGCVQSGSDHQWYQCQQGGSFALTDGSGSGPLGACVVQLGL